MTEIPEVKIPNRSISLDRINMYLAKYPCVLFRLIVLGWKVLFGKHINGSFDESPAEQSNWSLVQNTDKVVETDLLLIIC